MKLACDFIKPWLVPYSEGTLRVHRPSLHATVRRHLSGCASCRQDEVLLHKTAMALRRHSQTSSSRPRRPRNCSVSDIPLSNRVLQLVHAERASLASRATRTAQRAYPIIAYSTSVALLCTFFAFLTQPSIARPWLDRYFAHRHMASTVKHEPITPPYPMHDPFAIPASNRDFETAGGWRGNKENPFAPVSGHSSLSKIRTASLSATSGSLTFEKSEPSLSAPMGAGDVQAREAMMTAEQAEESRMASQATQPSPIAKAEPLSTGFALTPLPSQRTTNTSTPIVVGRSIVSSNSASNVSTASSNPAAAQTKPTTPGSAVSTQTPQMPAIPDAVPASPGSTSSTDSHTQASR